MHRVKHAIKHHWTHYLGLTSSSLCLIHCIAVPLVIPFLPALSALDSHSWLVEGTFIFLMGCAALTIFNGYRLHKSYPTLIYAGVGLVFLIASLFMHDSFALQLTTSCIGSAFMLIAHYTNYKLCRVQVCCPKPHH